MSAGLDVIATQNVCSKTSVTFVMKTYGLTKKLLNFYKNEHMNANFEVFRTGDEQSKLNISNICAVGF